MFSDRQSGKSWMRTWIEEAEASGIGAMVKMAKTLGDHGDGIPAYFKHRITSGPMEGMNNRVRTRMKVTYGLRDEEDLDLRLKSLHETGLRLTGRL